MTLTPYDIAQLRASVRHLAQPTIGANALRYSLWYDPTTMGWALVEWGDHGRPVCSGEASVLVQLVMRESREPGFVRRCLDTSADCEEALRPDPEYQARRDARIAASAAQAQARLDAAEATAAKRRASLFDPKKLSLADL